MPAYNGHKSWNQWNISLWINNDEALYREAYDLVSRYGVAKAANRLARDLEGQRTPTAVTTTVPPFITPSLTFFRS